MQVGGCGRERHGVGPNQRRDAAHVAVQVHAEVGHGGRGTPAPARAYPAAGQEG